jgi:hypothetical protein
MPLTPICLWCRDVLDESHSPEQCRQQIMAQDESDDPPLRTLREVVAEQPAEAGAGEHRGA